MGKGHTVGDAQTFYIQIHNEQFRIKFIIFHWMHEIVVRKCIGEFGFFVRNTWKNY